MFAFAIIFAISVALAAGVAFMFRRNPRKWYGHMLCHACGYRWKTRKPTPSKKCGKCWDENVVPVSEAEPMGMKSGDTLSTRRA
ncbi:MULTISPECIES: hypothetical protein [Niveibacterium]|uniref:Uncharacterized protein n=1 Tax=Niveibacterium microcysteis TaxID=2811415 RepID=A0ABX7M9I8_9RHOO|nr:MULTISPECIES: hypothetical protein [Niveibacterium]QSI78397.1 hypothetical protein JY500_07165 [Niveibacterium microcysteis]